jgi:tRNA threonylcarbamoyladenosine biosynthesis protein TsaB
MKVMAIDTATSSSSVALGIGREVVAAAEHIDRRGHAEFLVPAIDFCFRRAGWSPSDLDAVVVDAGPGLYTGIRVGIAAAQGMAATLGIPVLPANSLDALALEATTGHRQIWAVVDVRRGQLAACSYRPVPGGVVKEGPAQLVSPEQLRAILQALPDEVLLVGDLGAFDESMVSGLHRVKTGRPRFPAARALIQIGAGQLERGEVPGPEEIRPLYLREPDVNLNFEKLSPVDPWLA